MGWSGPTCRAGSGQRCVSGGMQLSANAAWTGAARGGGTKLEKVHTRVKEGESTGGEW